MNPHDSFQNPYTPPSLDSGADASYASRLKMKFRNRYFLVAVILLASVVVAGAGYGGYSLLAVKSNKPHASTKTPAPSKTKTTPKKSKSVKPASKKPKANKSIVSPTKKSATTTGIRPPSRSTATTKPKTSSGVPCKTYCYLWVGGRQYVTASGVSISFGQARPKLSSTDYHTLVELSVMSTDGKQIVEVGWMEAPDINGDSIPRLFVYHWVNGGTSCYNACGYVQVSSKVAPGQAVAVGKTGTYKINYSGGQWQIFYNGTEMGYFPESLWSGKFTKIGFTETFGEIAARSPKSCSQMGNGIFGSSAGSLLISNYTLLGSATTPYLSPYNVNNFSSSPNSGYNYGSATPTSVRIGGPGAC